MASCSEPSAEWMFLINHVFLPPKLPQGHDATGPLQEHLGQEVLKALRTFKNAYGDPTSAEFSAIDAAIGALASFLRVHHLTHAEGDVTIKADNLQEALNKLREIGSAHPLILHVAAQNAGILAYRAGTSVTLEMFELSARNESVTGTAGRLRRQFPGIALCIPAAKLEPALLETVARTLDKMSAQTAPNTIPEQRKGDRTHEETRDTPHPKMVTELLAAYLLPLGAAVDVAGVRKHTRDEVLWRDCKMPWRRSPLWLLIKVSIQLIFLRSGLEAQDATDLYKHFMVSFAVHILSETTSRLRDDPDCTEWCDLVYCMMAKIRRRILKLESPLPQSVQHAAKAALEDDVLQQTWNVTRKSEAEASRIDVESLRLLDFEKDTFAKIPKLDEFINSLSTRKGETMKSHFTPTCPLPEFANITDWNDMGCPKKNALTAAWCDSQLSNLNAWLDPKLQQRPLDPLTPCTGLWQAMRTYQSMVEDNCEDNPEAVSLMVLGVMELWVACDRLACKECPLLREYDPDISIHRLQPLLLPFRPQMERLRVVENYLFERRKQGVYKNFWTSFGEKNTFAVRYFDQSSEHQALRDLIEARAKDERERKVREFYRLRETYTTLMAEYKASVCDEASEMRNGQAYTFHPTTCRRCDKNDRATRLGIEIHEWPLPTGDSDLKTVVFELQVPRWLRVWREATCLVRFKLLRCSYGLEDSPGERFPLNSDMHLAHFFDSDLPAGGPARIGLLSRAKPNARTHYKAKPISGLSQAIDILCKNASKFQYFDFTSDCMVEQLSSTKGMDKLMRCMTYQLPSRSLAIQKFIHRTPTSPNGPPPNAVLASQSECPGHLSLTEYKALCAIPQGLRIQWQNILLQVTAPTVDFKKDETSSVIFLCMYQAGPPAERSWYRDAHTIPASTKTFGETILRSLRDATDRIEDNWRCVSELGCYVAIARRVISLSRSDVLTRDALAYLSRAREVGLSWVAVLKDRADSATDGEKCRFRARVARAALVCVDTFNFQDAFTTGVDILCRALRSSSDAADFIECCITIQECFAPTTDGLDSILHWRWQQLCFRAYPILHRAIVSESSDALDVAIQRSWTAFKPTGTGWTALSRSGCRHGGAASLATESALPGGEESLAVHYCLLTGELRVNGLPLNRLPTEYEKHPMYASLFGNAVLDVMPGHVPGMVFSGKKRYAGYEVHFGLSHEPGGGPGLLLIRAVKDGRAWEFIDPKFLKSLPRRFFSDYIHWYDLSSRTVEFRPRANAWCSSDENWRLGVSASGKWRLTRGNDRFLVVPKLLNAQSHTAARMDTVFEPLVDAANLELIYRPSSSQLEIELPQLKLAFHLEKGSGAIQSRQFRGMSVDPDQDIGTLIGFKNKLVLRGSSEVTRRKVILLEGSIHQGFQDSHTRISMSRDSAVLSHAYDVDDRLGRLIDNGSLESKLLLCYLHALTSFCLPDPLTKRTGTEQALDILDSAAVKSFFELNEQHTAMLKNIAGLVAQRVYYPKHLKVMQTVSWAPSLGFLAQHNGFFKSVTSLFNAAAERAFFYKDRYVKPPTFKRVRAELVERDEIRTSAFKVSQYGAEIHTTGRDRDYPGRDTGQDSEGGRTAFALADYVVNNRARIPYPMPANARHYVWDYLVDASGESVLGSYDSTLGLNEATPEYDARWLLSTHHRILGKNLVLYHGLLSGRSQNFDKFDIAIWLSTLAFSKRANLPVIQLLAAMVHDPDVASVQPPLGISSFSPNRGHEFRKISLFTDLSNNDVYFKFSQCPEFRASRGKGWDEEQRSRGLYKRNRRRALDLFINCVQNQWPCWPPVPANQERRGEWGTYVRTDKAVALVRERTRSWYHNYKLEGYLSRIVDLIPASECVSLNALYAVKASASKTLLENAHRPGFIRKTDIFHCSPPKAGPRTPVEITLSHHEPNREQPGSGQTGLLADLVRRLDSMAEVAFEKDYVASLHQSIMSLATRKYEDLHIPPNAIDVTETYLTTCKERSRLIYSTICDALNSHMLRVSAANLPSLDLENATLERCFSSHWPRLSSLFLLRMLAREERKALPPMWKDTIVKYAVSLVEQQRAERMAAAARYNDTAALSSELLNTSHRNWDPLEHPDSLLLEVETGITIRSVQEEIAARMRSPPGSRNAVMQLNMGEGKSSVIVPIVASALADGTKLVRVFVAKPQSKQMFQMLVSKLGGLLDRVVFQMPFSRDLQVTLEEAHSIKRMLDRCRNVGGVLLVQPEHVLSLQQMGTEFPILPEKEHIGQVLNMTRHFLFRTARDIVDESDENFSVKFELVYTMGLQQPVDHSPQRWQTIQEILGIIRDIALDAQKEFPEAIEIHTALHPGSFPRTRVLKQAAMRHILDKLAERICDTGIAGFPLSRQPRAVRNAVRTYITNAELSEEEINRVEQTGPTGFWTDSVRPTLALLRGLVAGNVLGFALMQKRWRVNYGLAPDRCPATRLAVPYRAKDQPSSRSEFSHPDVVILLTCLSYYYSGLTDDDLFLAFDQLLSSNQAEIDYARWVHGNAEIPGKFKSLAGVNTEDRGQCVHDVFPHLRFSKAAIDYFLDHIVYPKDMKEFPSKLSLSGWDLGEEKTYPTTGFSGTNDSRGLLPLGMQQLDFDEQKHTNALVMSYLLQPETSVIDIPPRSPAQASDADALLDLVIGLSPPVRVILDVGAQVLELDNLAVARQWLRGLTDEHTRAAVFFDDNDELSVVDRSGHTERLQTSPFASQLDTCLVFLDEAHTRGTDLKLPTNYRAAVTLGAHQTKDGLMQGCMRMRNLGHGQSVVFCIPREIKTKIGELLPHNRDGDDIRVSDILLWSIRETWISLHRGAQLWAAQGRRYQKHQRLWNEFTGGEHALSADQAKQFLEGEAQTVLQRYRPEAPCKNKKTAHNNKPGASRDPILDRLTDFGVSRCDAAALYEEQERELAPEIETERQAELPPPTVPARHNIHPDVKTFITDGTIVPNSKAYSRAFQSLARTRIGREFDVAKISPTIAPSLFVTTDFARTVELPQAAGSYQDAYLRPVQWVLVSWKVPEEPVLLILSPFEANNLVYTIPPAGTTTLHVYGPRINPAFPSLDDLALYPWRRGLDGPIPRRLSVALNLFAGQLYFNDYEMYVSACRFLGISWERAGDDEVLDPDGFILRGSDGQVGGGSGFTKSPVKFFRDLMFLRRDSQAIGGTPVGDMLDNRPLSEGMFD